MKATTKQVTIIARYQFKADPRKVCYLVRASNGVDTYMACLFDGKATSCRCASRKPCYHMTQLEAREAQRNQPVAREDSLVEAPNGVWMTPEELANVPGANIEREQALAAARAASEIELAKIEQETLAQIEAEQSAPVAPKSEQARIADLDNEFPVGALVPTFHGAGVLVENGVVVEPVATNFEGINYVVVEQMESGERAGISCNDLRSLIRESIDEEAKVARWTEQEMLSAPLNGSRAFSLMR